MRATSLLLIEVGMAALALGCDGGSTAAAPDQVEIMHWWTAGGEKQAIDALLSDFETENPNETVINTPVDGSDAARMAIEQRMLDGQPPNTFQANGGGDLLAWVLYNDSDATNSKMTPIDELASTQEWAKVMPAAVLETVSYNGDVYAVPLDIHRVNTLFYNMPLYLQYQMEPPTSLDQMFAQAATFKAQGILAPIALGTTDGALPLIFFESLLVSRAGGDAYKKFMLGGGDPFGPELATAVDDLATLLTFANPNSASLSWDEAADRVLTGDAAMAIMGDWGKANMVSQGATENKDFGAVPTPAAPAFAGTFVFTTDTFGLPTGAGNVPGTLDLLKLFGSKEGQDLFNPLKGSISVRNDTDVFKYDVMGMQTITDFRQASDNGTVYAATAILAPPAFMKEVDKILLNFVVDGNKSTVIHSIANYYDILTASPLRGPLQQ